MENKYWKVETRKKWWEKKRLNYNVGIILSGITSFILYVLIVEFIVFKSEKNWDGEITIFTLISQGIGFLFMIGIANLFYFLGSFSETIFKPKNIEKYRNLTYKIGFWFSCALPFSIPTILFIQYFKFR